MKTEEAIEEMEKTVSAHLDYEALDIVIKAAKDSEKYKEIWKRLASEITRIQIIREHNTVYVINEKTDIQNISELMVSLQQKYFPKPEEVIDWKDRFYELEEEFEEKEKELTQHVEYWKFKFYGGK